MAYVSPYVLTKMDIAALRKCDYLTVRFDGTADNRVDAIKRAEKTESDPFATDQLHNIAAPITMHGYSWTPDKYAHVRCFSMVWLYHSQTDVESCILRTLRTGDAIAFEFYPDCHSNGYMAKAGLHGDALRMHVFRNDKQVARFEIDTQCCPDNSARMCKGIGATEEYKRQAEYVT